MNFVFQSIIVARAFYENIDNLTENEQYRISRQFEKYCMPKNTCFVWQGRTDSDEHGELRIQFRGKRLSLKVHRVAFALANKGTTVMSGNHDVSHLCHLKQCVNVAHLSYEPHAINNKRMTCRYEGECSRHHGYDDCILQVIIF